MNVILNMTNFIVIWQKKKINCKGKPDWCPLKEIDLKGDKI